MRFVNVAAVLLATGLLSICPRALRAQSAPQVGFELNRYHPTNAGEWSFLVDHPWYSSTRRFSLGLTLNYANNPLNIATVSADGLTQKSTAAINHLLTGNLDFAISFADRVTLNASLPATLLSLGPEDPVAGVIPPPAGVNDPRLGAMVRVYGQPDASPVSVNLGVQLWAPLQSVGGDGALYRNDAGVRVLPKLVLAGYGHHVRWSFVGAFLYRGEAQLLPGDFGGNTAGSELQLGASVQYADKEQGIAVGLEALMATLVVPNHAFEPQSTSLEVLMGAHYNIINQVQLGVAGGLGMFGQVGKPDGRFLLRLAYAPIKVPPKDRDRDGVIDPEDACSDQAGVRTGDPRTNGCPPDRDQDGVADADDQCPETAMGPDPDPARSGCPLLDRDRDEVMDKDDQCPDVAKGERPDPAKPGCPLMDKDGDTVFDGEDQCPDAAMGEHPDPQRKGCPAEDRDHDGVYDPEDACPEVAPGLKPDPQKKGCPAQDRDSDTVVDHEDACPDKPGAPSPDPAKNGCPGLVEVKLGRVTIKEQVFFDLKKDTIQKKSYPLLLAVADALKASPQIKKVEVQGHTDNVGLPAFNLSLSDRRARSVMRFLVDNGIAAERLGAKGYGPTRPIADNKTAAGKALNRRVEFVILDPPQPAASPGTTAPAPAAPAVPPAAGPAKAPGAGAKAPAAKARGTGAKPGAGAAKTPGAGAAKGPAKAKPAGAPKPQSAQP